MSKHTDQIKRLLRFSTTLPAGSGSQGVQPYMMGSGHVHGPGCGHGCGHHHEDPDNTTGPKDAG